MKNVILSAIAVMAFGFANAQEVKYGVKGGLNLSNLSGDTDGMDLKSKFGFHAGGFVEIKFSEKFALQPELLYSTQGTRFDDLEVNGYKTKTCFNLDYINVPVMFKYFAAEKFFIEAGPQIGFLTSAKARVKIDELNIDNKEDIKDNFESIDFGLNFGAGYEFTENIFASARYNLGLSNIAKTEADDDSKVHNGVFSLSVGYKF
ncbi:OMP_b-brl_2 multi-domain protein [Flavobacterium anhuiense]|uniref:OMP_b-brl_2 multi-domain protein n=1 Tax=Flavobacterium anhuiense TaxID=459526 RepID=A0A444VVH9_9FLAO|nr:porin family protein [Flavobacterium anhuiense]RYJ37701.1 OMP_b-brl_2 multi-domain protein [Flavobacterium anhuiense]